MVGIARHQSAADFPGRLITADLGDRAASEAVFDALGSSVEVDAVINNVGLVQLQPLEKVQLADFDAGIDVNVRPALQAAQTFVPGMRARRWGRIVNVSSLVVTGMAGRTSYAAAKAALVSFARTWALETARDGITVNCVAPGPTDTERFRAGNPAGSPGEQSFLQLTPRGRFARPDEIAGAIAFLLSDDADMITGQTLFIDGGASIGRSSFP